MSVGSLVDAIEESCRARYARWNPRLWRQLCEGPAQRLAEALHAGRVPVDQGEALLETYLRLGADGIGLGYLVPGELGRETFFGLAWQRLLPDGLAGLPAGRRAATLAQCFNLGENLALGPGWLHRIFLRVAGTQPALGELERLVDDVARQAQEAPARRLGKDFRIDWVFLAGEDARFLPGAMHFLAPTVVCVHDRHRTGGGGRAAATMGVWLTDPPVTLGPMGCEQHVQEKDAGLRLELLETMERADARAAEYRGMVGNDWRAAVSLETSQFLAVLLPQ